MKINQSKEIVLILDNIRSAENVGSIFRTADAIGVSKIYLVGITPTPIDRFKRPRTDVAKTALGAQQSISWEYKKTIKPLITKLKKEECEIIALEQDKESKDYKKITLKQKVAVVLGNEVSGISKNTLKECDQIVEIPMYGKKESLNVSVSTGIVLFRMFDNSFIR